MVSTEQKTPVFLPYLVFSSFAKVQSEYGIYSGNNWQNCMSNYASKNASSVSAQCSFIWKILINYEIIRASKHITAHESKSLSY